MQVKWDAFFIGSRIEYFASEVLGVTKAIAFQCLSYCEDVSKPVLINTTDSENVILFQSV